MHEFENTKYESTIVPEVFLSEVFGELRAIEIDNKIYFAGVDVARALGYSNPYDAVRRHCKSDGLVKHEGVINHDAVSHGNRYTTKQTVEIVFLSEGNVYRLIVRSKLKEAEQFEKWVFDEILPTIRNTGGYVNDAKLFVESYLSNTPADTQKMILDVLQVLKAQDKVIGAQKPSVDFARAVGQAKTAISIGDFAKMLQNEQLDIGRNRLFDWLRNKGYLLKGSSVAKQQYITQGIFTIKESVYYTGRYSHVTATTLVTPKGQMYLAERIRKDFLKM